MFVALIDILFLCFAAAGGAALGVWLGSSRQRVIVVNGSSPQIISPQVETPKPAHEALQVKQVMTRLHELATSVAADVDKHNTRVQRISDELSASDFDSKVVATAVAQLIEANKQMQQRLNSAEERLQEQSRQMETHAVEARTDALTQVANRRALDARIAECAEAYFENQEPFSVMILDVDHFKNFNDTYGHQAGDEVLRSVAKVLRQSVGKNEFVARYGGEEFAIVFPGTKVSAAKKIADRARAAVGSSEVNFEGQNLRVTASAGVAELNEAETIAMLIRRADEALYAAKSAGRDCGFWHDGDAAHPITARIAPPPQPTPIATTAVTAEPKKPAVTVKALEKRPAATTTTAPFGPAISLTELPTRSAFCEDVDRRLGDCRRGGSSFSLLLVSVDQLSQIKSNYGNDTCELVLRATTQLLRAGIRSMDCLARYDDDLFSVTLPNLRANEALALSERLRTAVLRCKLPVNGRPLQFTVTIGVVEAAENDSRINLLVRAKSTLDAALRHGGNCSFVHGGRQCCSADEYQVATAH